MNTSEFIEWKKGYQKFFPVEFSTFNDGELYEIYMSGFRKVKPPVTDKTIWLSVDLSEPCTFETFYLINTERNVEQLTETEFEIVKNLKVGESVNFGMSVEIKRVSL